MQLLVRPAHWPRLGDVERAEEREAEDRSNPCIAGHEDQDNAQAGELIDHELFRIVFAKLLLAARPLQVWLPSVAVGWTLQLTALRSADVDQRD